MRTELQDRVRQAIELGRRLYVDDLKAGRVPNRTFPKYTTTENGSRLDWEKRPDSVAWASSLDFGDPRCELLRDTSRAIDSGLPEATPPVVRRQGGEAILRCALGDSATTDLLTQQEVSNEALLEAIDDLVDQQLITAESVWGLRGVAIEGPTQLGDGWLFAPTDVQRSLLAPIAPGFGLSDAHSADVLLVTRRKVNGDSLRTGWTDEVGPRVISALRLASRADLVALGPLWEGMVFGLAYFAEMRSGGRMGGASTGHEPHPQGKEPLTPQTIADAAEIAPVVDRDRFLTLAISRLTQASTRRSRVDRMVDLMIAAEALLATPDENAEITYRVALRGARLLDELPNRAATRRLIKQCYGARSKIVHGIVDDAEERSVAEFAECVRRLALYAARALCRHRGKGLIDEIENAMIGDSESATLVDGLRRSAPV